MAQAIASTRPAAVRRPSLWRLSAFSAILTVATAALWLVLACGCSKAVGVSADIRKLAAQGESDAAGVTVRLEGLAPVVDLGTVAPHATKCLLLALKNGSMEPIDMSRVSMSCECARLETSAARIQPGHTVPARLLVNLEGEEEEAADLRIEVRYRTAVGEVVLFEVDVSSHQKLAGP